jgi:hypothetical protein
MRAGATSTIENGEATTPHPIGRYFLGHGWCKSAVRRIWWNSMAALLGTAIMNSQGSSEEIVGGTHSHQGAAGSGDAQRRRGRSRLGWAARTVSAQAATVGLRRGRSLAPVARLRRDCSTVAARLKSSAGTGLPIR